MLLFPNAKINLGLRILKKRDDGFHEIETCMYPIPWCDALEIVKSDDFSFQSTGLPIEGDPNKNLVVKAYELMKEAFDISPIKIHLHKVIPMGAGLGGGSSDAATMIKLINQEFELGLSPQMMRNYAAELGSDCAFFIDNIPAICTGRGEIMEPIDFTLSGLKLVLVNPEIHISTADAYSGAIPKQPSTNLNEIIMNPQNLKEQLINDFEESIFIKYPQLADIKQRLYDSGAIYASLSGSGSTIFGLFDEMDSAKIIFPEYNVKMFDL